MLNCPKEIYTKVFWKAKGLLGWQIITSELSIFELSHFYFVSHKHFIV